MRWFGKYWGAPVNETTPGAPVPLGERCAACDNPIEATDRGFLIPAARMNAVAPHAGGPAYPAVDGD